VCVRPACRPSRLNLRLDLRWSSQLTTHSLGAIIDPGEAALRQETFVMHEQATTLKHYLKVVPQRKVAVDGQVSPNPTSKTTTLSQTLILILT